MNVVRANLVVPTSLELVRLNLGKHVNDLTDLKSRPFVSLQAPERESHPSGVASVNFQNIGL